MCFNKRLALSRALFYLLAIYPSLTKESLDRLPIWNKNYLNSLMETYLKLSIMLAVTVMSLKHFIGQLPFFATLQDVSHFPLQPAASTEEFAGDQRTDRNRTRCQAHGNNFSLCAVMVRIKVCQCPLTRHETLRFHQVANDLHPDKQ